MVKQLSMGPSRLWYDATDPGLSETNIDVFNWWLNTVSGDFFTCLDNTIGAQSWEKVLVQGDDIQFGDLTAAAGGALQTSTGSGNTLLLQAYDVDGAAYTTFGTLTAGNTPTFNATISTLTVGSSGSPTITSGTGAPGSSQPKGSLYLRTDGSGVNDRMYVATDAVGGWTAVVTVA